MPDDPVNLDETELLPTRRSLLSRLKDWNDQESWREFFDTYWKLIYRAALKAGLTPAESQDVVQETLLSVAKAMPDFHYDPALGSFKHWLLKLTGWRVGDQFRKRLPGKPAGTAPADETRRTSTEERIPDPGGASLETVWDEEWEKNLMESALARVKRRVDPKHYQIFDFYVLQGWPVQKVARTLKVSAGSVYLVKHRLSALLKREVQYLQKRMDQTAPVRSGARTRVSPTRGVRV